MMKGWRTWVAVAGYVLLAVYDFVEGHIEEAVAKLAFAAGLIGLGTKIEKNA